MAFLLLSGAGGVLAAGLVVPLAAGANTAADGAVQVFDELPDDLEPGPLAQLSTIYYEDGQTQIARIYTENRIVKPLDQIAQPMQDAVIAIEDRRFWKHGGVDLEGIPRAVVNNLQAEDTQGASTLTQQYVKNVLIEKAVRDEDPVAQYAASEGTLHRKAREAKLAISLEKTMTKEEILQGYLNIAQFGASTYGVETAAQRYFTKSAADLTYIEAATIAGITQNPAKYDPTVDPKAAQDRRDVVLNQMFKQGYITKDEYDAGWKTPIADTLHIRELDLGCQSAGDAAFFCDFLTREIVSNPVFGETEDERKSLLYRGGLKIVTTLHAGMQAQAQAQALAAVPAQDPSNVSDVIVSVEPGSGKILAMAQNKPYGNPEVVARGTRVNYAADEAHGGSTGFSPGSSWKPFVLAEWLRTGHSLYQSVNADSRGWRNSDFDWCRTPPPNESKVWKPGNSDGKDDKGNISVLQATFNSINTAYANMESQLRLCDIKTTAESIGFKPARESEQGAGVKTVPSMVLGTQETSPLQMAAAYATFASGGTYCDPIAITSVTGPDGAALAVPSANCNPNALDPGVASLVTYALQSVLTQGAARNTSQLADGRPAAGKTGTANRNTHNWFIGYTPQVSTAVWIGTAETNVEMRNFTINGVRKPWWFGSDLAAPTWKRYMDGIHAGAPIEQFPTPDRSKIDAPPPPPEPIAPTPDPSAPGADTPPDASANRGGTTDTGNGADG